MADYNNEKRIEALETGTREDLPERRASTGNKFSRSLSVAKYDDDAREGQLYSMGEVDPALDAKMHILNSVSPMRVARSDKTSHLTCARPLTRSDGPTCIRSSSF